jgi:hypothetical protein
MAGSGKDTGSGRVPSGRVAAGSDETRGLNEIISSLRADVPVRTAWREDVLSEVRDVAARGTRDEGSAMKRWTISPPAAIAAAIAFTALGAAAAVGVLSTPNEGPQLASSGRPEVVSPLPAAHRPLPVHFALVAPGASRVSLVGDFNQWDASATPMRPLGDGRLWLVEVPLPPGRHVYAFVVDGDVTPDPAAPRAGEEDFGVPSSVVLVGPRGS